MIEYFEEQLKSAKPYKEKDLMENIELRKGLYFVEGLQRYGQYFYEHLGQRVLYFFVSGYLEDPLHSVEMVKCFEGDLEQYKDCLKYVPETFNKVFPAFVVIDKELFNKLKLDFRH